MHLYPEIDSRILSEPGTAAQTSSTNDTGQFYGPPSEKDRELKERLETAFSDSLDRFGATCLRTAGETEDLVSAARELAAAGGKRIRPRLVYWGWRAAGRPDCDEIIELAVAVAAFHLFSLVHDDVMDLSDSRRGVLTAHRRLATAHRDRGWRGNAAQKIITESEALEGARALIADRVASARRALAATPIDALVKQSLLELVTEVSGGPRR